MPPPKRQAAFRLRSAIGAVLSPIVSVLFTVCPVLLSKRSNPGGPPSLEALRGTLQEGEFCRGPVLAVAPYCAARVFRPGTNRVCVRLCACHRSMLVFLVGITLSQYCGDQLCGNDCLCQYTCYCFASYKACGARDTIGASLVVNASVYTAHESPEHDKCTTTSFDCDGFHVESWRRRIGSLGEAGDLIFSSDGDNHCGGKHGQFSHCLKETYDPQRYDLGKIACFTKTIPNPSPPPLPPTSYSCNPVEKMCYTPKVIKWGTSRT